LAWNRHCESKDDPGFIRIAGEWRQARCRELWVRRSCGILLKASRDEIDKGEWIGK
jgi:hypothetical protein